jgi:uncharacterized membrane protein YeaQ/YmgE (transglycosylase-associated protein family)
MAIILWLVIGLVVGWLAGRVMRSSHGTLVDLVLGVVGSLVGRFISDQLLVAVLGAMLLLVLHRLLFARRVSRV